MKSMSEGYSGNCRRCRIHIQVGSLWRKAPPGAHLSWSLRDEEAFSQAKRKREEGAAPNRSRAQSKPQKRPNDRTVLKGLLLTAINVSVSPLEWRKNDLPRWWYHVFLNQWWMASQQNVRAETGGSRSELRPKNDSVRSHFMLWKSHKFPETKVNYTSDEPTEREMWTGKKGGGKASRWHGQMSPKELTHNFSFSFYSSCWQVLLQFYEDFLINKNFKKYCMMLCFLHFKEMKRHIKFISLLWRLRSRIYSIEFKLTKYLHLGIEGFFFFSTFKLNPDVFNPCKMTTDM